MLRKILSISAVAFLLTSVISFVGVTTANATAPVIASTSTISSTQANPSLTFTTSTGSFGSASTSNWTVSTGSTGLTYNSLSVSNGTQATIGFSGTATCGGTVTVQAKAAAFTSPSQTENSNTLSFVISSPGCVAPVIESTSTITAGQVNPTLVITTASTFRANPSNQNANFSITGGAATGLSYTGISLSGNTITIALTGTATPGTLTLSVSRAAFDPNPGLDANTLQFVVPKVPATNGAMSFSGMNTGVTANASAPNSVSGGSGQWTQNSLISWSPSLTNSRFAAGVVYTATVTLAPSGGTFEGLSSSFFTFSGATSVSATYAGNPRTSATVTIVFPATAGGSQLSACNADLLASSSTIKGVAITLGQSRSSDAFSDFYMPGPLRGSVTLTEAQASGSGTTSMTTTDGSPVYWLYIPPTMNSFSHRNISGTSNQASETVVGGRDFIVRVVPTTCAEQYYWLTINVGSSGGSSSSSQQTAAQAAAAAAAQAAAVLAAAVAKANVVLTSQFSTNKAATLEQFLDAGYGVRNSNVAANVSAAILKLPVADRDKTQKINEIINVENFIDRVAVLGTRSTVRSSELVSRSLLPADSIYKYSVVQGLASYPDGSLNSLEKIAAAVKEQIYKAEAPKRRLAEIKAKIAARGK